MKRIFLLCLVLTSCTPTIVSDIRKISECGNQSNRGLFPTTKTYNSFGSTSEYKIIVCCLKVDNDIYPLPSEYITEGRLVEFIVSKDSSKYQEESIRAREWLRYLRSMK